MYSDFALKLKTGMTNLDFTAIMLSEDLTPVSAYIRISNPVVYVVQAYNCDEVSFESIEYKLSTLSESIESQLSQLRCTKAVFINLLYTDKNNKEIKSFCDLKEPDYSNINSVWWYTDGKSLNFGKNQPNKVFGIQNTINNILSDNFEINEVKEVIKKKPEHKTIVPVVTYLIIAINIFVWFILNMYGTDTAYKFANSSTYVFQKHQYYRLFTCMFVHISFVHLFYNCFSLYIFGRVSEKCFGWLKYILIYISSGIAASFISAMFLSGFAIGASGAVYGVMGALLSHVRINKRDIHGFNYPTLFLFIVAGIGLGMMDKNVDNFAHIGGVIFGFLLVFVIEKISKAVNK